jgi:tripartite-type tricarboxylate transporter receptor subunit TctC
MKIARSLATACLLAAAVGAGGSALAQDKYPSRPVTVIVPQAAGGANDAIARVVAQKLTEQTGQTFIVENRPGAGGNLGTAAAAKAKNDGYTLLLTVNSAHVINPSLYKSTGFDPVKDFEPISPVATAGYVLVANNAFPPKNVAELVAAAKAAPGKYTIAVGRQRHAEPPDRRDARKAAGIELTHVPYKGASAAVTDLVGGQVQVSVQSLPSSIASSRAASSRCSASSTRSASRPCPTCRPIGETIKGFGSTPWYGLFAPAGTPKADRRAAAGRGRQGRSTAPTPRTSSPRSAASRSRRRPSSSPR